MEVKKVGGGGFFGLIRGVRCCLLSFAESELQLKVYIKNFPDWRPLLSATPTPTAPLPPSPVSLIFFGCLSAEMFQGPATFRPEAKFLDGLKGEIGSWNWVGTKYGI